MLTNRKVACPSPKRAACNGSAPTGEVRSRCPPPGAVSRYPTRGEGDLPRESSGNRKSPRRPESDVSPGRIGPGGRATARAVARRTLVEASKCPPTEAEVGIVGEPTHSFDEEGDGSRDSSGIWTCFSSRRRGDGTCGRSTDPKQGRSRSQPRPSRRARPPV